MMEKKFTRLLAAIGVAMSFLSGAAVAAEAGQAYPDKPIRLVVPYPAGAAVDNMGRLIGDELRKSLGQPVVVENRAGAGSQIGTAHVAKAPADGYTLLITTLDALTLFPLVRDLPYKPDTELMQIARIARIPYSIQANPSLNISSPAQLIAHAKANPGLVRYGSTGNGSLAHVAMELFAHKANIELTHVPYKGMAASVNDLLAGHIDVAVVSTSTIAPHMAAGKVRAVTLMADKRNPMWADIPALDEVGISGVEAELEFVVVAPAGVPQPVVDKLSDALAEVVEGPDFQKSLAKMGMAPAFLSAEKMVDYRDRDAKKWAGVVAGMTIEKEGS